MSKNQLGGDSVGEKKIKAISQDVFGMQKHSKRLHFILAVCAALLPFAACAATSLGGGVFQSDGSLSDTQTAVNDAPDGGTVIIRNGTFTWNGQLHVNGGTYSDGSPKGKSVNLFGQSLNGVTIINDWKTTTAFTNQQLIDVQPSPNFTLEIKWLNFQEGPLLSGVGSAGNMHILAGPGGGWGISAQNKGKVILLHDCTFSNNGNMSYQMRFLTPMGGVVWNCTFNSTGSGSADGISLQGGDGYKSPSTMGALDTTGLNNFYVEDCIFNGWNNGFAMDISDGARAVVRHCTFNASLLGTHGQESTPYGYRHMEVYNCTFQNAGRVAPYVWMSIRGGTFVVYNNNFGKLPTGTPNNIVMECLALQRKATYLSCPTRYPIPRQIGQGWSGGPGSYSYPQYPADGTGYILDPAYFWNNTIAGANLYGFENSVDTCGNGLHTSDFILRNRDFYSGTTPKPGYTAFAYPHPLRTGRSTTTISVPNVVVPNVVGMTEADAGTAIINSGLVVGTDVFQSGGTAGNVVSQSPAAGTTVAPGSTVTETISIDFGQSAGGRR